jgi:HK97 family phage portal protein
VPLNLFGFTIARNRGALAPTEGGWYPLVREPYTGAWQQNAAPVTVESVLTNPTVFRCYSLITTDIGKTPNRLVQHDRAGNWTETSSPAFSPVLRRPNRYQLAQQFYEAWVGSKLLYGNTYVLKERDDRNVVRALYVLNPAHVRPLVAPDGSVYYELRRNELAGVGELEAEADRPIIVPARELIHDRWNCLYHPLVGVSPLYACAGAAVQGLKIQDASTAFFANGSQPAGIVLVPGALNDTQVAKLKEQWDTTHGGMNRGGTGFLTHGMTYHEVSQTATDSQLTEQQRMIAQTIAGVWGVPISMVDSSQQPPYANHEASSLQYRSQCLQTLMTAIENCLDDGLELPEPYGTEFDIDALIWMDTATKTAAAKDGIGSGALSPNEARGKYFGLAGVPGGDSPFMQQQYYALEALADRPAPATPEPTPTPEPEPEPVP